MSEIRAELSKHPVKTRVSLTGTVVVARDIAHAKLQERLDRGEGLPDYMKNHPVYYAARPRRRRATPRAASAPPPPGAWTAMSRPSRRPAARS
jgi:fumarate hydratase class I